MAKTILKCTHVKVGGKDHRANCAGQTHEFPLIGKVSFDENNCIEVDSDKVDEFLKIQCGFTFEKGEEVKGSETKEKKSEKAKAITGKYLKEGKIELTLADGKKETIAVDGIMSEVEVKDPDALIAVELEDENVEVTYPDGRVVVMQPVSEEEDDEEEEPTEEEVYREELEKQDDEAINALIAQQPEEEVKSLKKRKTKINFLVKKQFPAEG